MEKSHSTIPPALIEHAIDAQKNAYAPYSEFQVGAALLDADGNIHAGCNVENAAYPLGQCAEAGAISTMILSGCKQIEQIVIVGSGDSYCPPCGGCRQKIAEFADNKTRVHLLNKSGEVKTVLFSELLPFSFGFEKDKR
ncbi:cytidine deaminase [Paraglaciecola aquimarina]|uniref:Cytidine deaminase n=1 Tax=Paraglaciecola aquimarina TaxID=1235557 RepID=A0ABU3SVF6_9ALTE|nr:cytidine deaminase [Paraglaciecola aquimarina]MDU0353973.1 cytidine deaminase [Paraglaciecola aquimarina]